MKVKLKVFVLMVTLTAAFSAVADSAYLDGAAATQVNVAEQKQNNVGIGLGYKQQIYTGVGNTAQPFPLLNLSYDDFFIQSFTVGYNAFQDNALSVAAVVQPMFGGYNASDSDALAGMNDTSYLINTGAQVQYRLLPFSFTVAALHDISGRTGGNSADVKIAAMVPLDDRRFVLIPSISANWESSDITRYYYGVSASEATSSRPKYDPATAVNLGYGLSLKYRMAQHWGAMLGYVLTQYANAISDSPIVDRKYASMLLAGVTYSF